jgi:protein-arginine kinase activator protein McsA
MQAFITPQIKRETCPFCATTAVMVRDSGLMGCPICYEAFPDLARQLSILEPQ